MINLMIKQLVDYGINQELIRKEDEIFVRNMYLDLLGLDSYEDCEQAGDLELHEILEGILNYAVENGIIEDGIASRDLFDTKLMAVMMPFPSTVIDIFRKKYEISPKDATDYFYKLSQDSNYIRRDRIQKDIRFAANTESGQLDISINLSKPEKDPKAIAAEKSAKQVGYPKCLLCIENEGYAGRMNHPARGNHRIIPIMINDTKWGFQYSPYVYFNEHCIVFNQEHIPMKIERATFAKLLDFVAQFPHYFVGSNADLPIVGGSILSHDHFQGGCYEFPMAKANDAFAFTIPSYEDVEASIVAWPMSVIRIRHTDKEKLVSLADHILEVWRGYSDEDAFIFAETNGEKHNTITPIARMRNGKFELDLVLRNNITTEEHPMGVYHPHESLHHIKKENIGLIEVMGLAVLPSRLKVEMEALRRAILDDSDMKKDEMLNKHADWFDEWKIKYDNLTEDNLTNIINEEIGHVFSEVLKDAGVYKRNEKGLEAFRRFIYCL